ncbi:MAG: hypothetical protein GF308_03965 [Candidatus Heimdallarchaeota archaeon]|nr:hypothetical protein [Candidatus Heimdallarchaeota archaeon]
MSDLKQLLVELDQRLLSLFNSRSPKKASSEETSNVNITGDHSLKLDLLMEDEIIAFFREQDFPCVIEAEERGRTELVTDPQFLVITDPLDGSNNFRRRIPLVCYGIAIAAIPKDSSVADFTDIQAAAVRSLFTDEFYLALKGQGATCNGKNIWPSKRRKLRRSIISFDLDHAYPRKPDLVASVMNVVKHCAGTRRFGANLLDMVYVGAGKVEAMIDLRNNLSVVHSSAAFISQEAGAVLCTSEGKTFRGKLVANEHMSFILAANDSLKGQILHYLHAI